MELGYGDFEPIETMQFIPGWSTFYLAGIELDIITEMKGLENISFKECLDASSSFEIENVTVPFLHINHLIQNKKATNRPKDQIDIIQLEKIREMRSDPPFKKY